MVDLWSQYLEGVNELLKGRIILVERLPDYGNWEYLTSNQLEIYCVNYPNAIIFVFTNMYLKLYETVSKDPNIFGTIIIL